MSRTYLQYIHEMTSMANHENPFVSSGAERTLEREFEEITEYLELELKDDISKNELELAKHFRLLANKLQEFNDNKE